MIKTKTIIVATLVFGAINMASFSVFAETTKSDAMNLKINSPNLVRAYDKIKIFDAWDFINSKLPPLSPIVIGIFDTGIDASDGRHPEFLGVNFGQSNPLSLRDRAEELNPTSTIVISHTGALGR